MSGPNMPRSTIPPMPRIYLERREMGEELRRLFDLLDSEARASAPAGECDPQVDVLETNTEIEVIVDLPGVASEQVHVVYSRGTILIAGTKRGTACAHSDVAFHLAER